MAWTIDYADSALAQLRKLDRQVARRIVDFMDERIARLADPRPARKALTGPLGTFWRHRVGNSRVVGDIQDETVRILALRVGNRRDVYRQ